MSKVSPIARAAVAVALATGMSRLLGLVREASIAHLFPTCQTDAFWAAFRIPNVLRDLLAEGALAAAFLPIFAEVNARKGREAAFRLINGTLNGLLLITGLFALSILLFSKGYALSVASGFSEPKLALCALLARVMSPFLTLLALAAVLAGMSNLEGRFFIPAAAPALFNVGVLAGAWWLAPWFEKAGYPGVTGLAAGAVLGGLMNLGTQIPGVHQSGFRYRPVLDFSDPALRRLLARLVPALLGVGATYLNVVLDNQIASRFGDGPVSLLSYALRLWLLPVGLIGVALSTANLAGVSRDAALGDMVQFKKTLATSIRINLLLTIPAAVALAFLSSPIVRVVYQRGRFGVEETETCALLLTLYAIGLPGYTFVKLFVPTLYALHRPWIPVVIAGLVVGLKIPTNVLLWHWRLDFSFLALTTGLAALLNGFLTGAVLFRTIGFPRGEGIGRAAGIGCIASVAMVGVTWAVGRLGVALIPGEDWGRSAVRLGCQIAAGLLLVALSIRWSGLPEVARMRRR